MTPAEHHDAKTPQVTAPAGPTTLRLGFARGTAPSKWAARYAAAFPGRTLELAALDATFGRSTGSNTPERADTVDVMLERTLPGGIPQGVESPTTGVPATRHAIHLYTETIALVVPRDHEFAELESIDVSDLEFVHLLDHPGHAEIWAHPQPFADPSYRPKSIQETLDLVATGLGGMLLPRPLARHLITKREHALVTLTGEPLPQGSTIWATWEAARDDADIQQLVGILRGRTARSSRGGDDGDVGEHGDTPARKPPATSNKRPAAKLNPNSRGAQLAAAKDRAEAKKRAQSRGKKRGRRR